MLLLFAKGEKNQTKEFPTFNRDLEQLAWWLQANQVDMAVMESTGVFWKPLYRHIEEVGVPMTVVNAAHAKVIAGHKTDAEGFQMARRKLVVCGLFRAQLHPPRDFRELRIVTRFGGNWKIPCR